METVFTWTGPDSPEPSTHWVSFDPLPPVELNVERSGDDSLRVTSSGLTRDLRIEAVGMETSDNYLAVRPDHPVEISVRHTGTSNARGALEAENCPDGVRLPRPQPEGA